MARYDERTALLVVDVQNDFADPGGSLYVQAAEDAIPVVNDEIAAAEEGGALLVYTQDWHPESTPHFSKDGGIWPVHCVRDTWGAEFHPDLDLIDAPVVQKGTGGEDGYSAFSVSDPTTGERSATGLDAILRDQRIERVVIVGLATDYCVKESALDAVSNGYATLVLRDGVRPVNLSPGDGERALAEVLRAGGAVE